MRIEVIIFYILLVDSISATLTMWISEGWYTRHFRIVSRFFPPAKGWVTWYLVLVLFAGWILWNVGALPYGS